MTLDLTGAIEATARIATPKPNVLTLDIERLPGRARHEHRGLTIEGDFWDLNGWKHTIGYRLPIESVIEWPRTICVAWKWYGAKRVEFASEWDDGPEDMHRRVWEAYDRAHVIYGHNVDRFDTKHLNTGWRDLGLPEPSPFKSVDTLKEARKKFGDESMKLAALTQRLGINTKTDTYDVEVARAACAGNKAAQRRIKAYNAGDVVASEALVDRLRGWIKHPHNVIGTVDDRPTCPNCWGDNLTPNGTRLADLITYRLYRCMDCGKNVSGTRHSRAATTRSA
jgi:DNA polymerase elongation subunit (family B)